MSQRTALLHSHRGVTSHRLDTQWRQQVPCSGLSAASRMYKSAQSTEQHKHRAHVEEKTPKANELLSQHAVPTFSRNRYNACGPSDGKKEFMCTCTSQQRAWTWACQHYNTNGCPFTVATPMPALQHQKLPNHRANGQKTQLFQKNLSFFLNRFFSAAKSN